MKLGLLRRLSNTWTMFAKGVAGVVAESEDYFCEGETDRALACLDRLREKKLSPRMLYIVARLLCSAERDEGALHICEIAIEREPRNLRAHLLLAYLYGRLDRLQDEAEAFRQVVSLDPTLALACDRLGWLCIQSENLQEALDAFDEKIRSDPERPWGWLGRGHVLIELNRYEDAADALERAVHIKPDCGYALGLLGQALAELDLYEESVEAFREAVKLEPEDHVHLVNLGVAEYRLEHLDEARAAIERGLRIMPEDVRAHELLAEICQLLGDEEGASREHAVIDVLVCKGSSADYKPVHPLSFPKEYWDELWSMLT